MNVSREGEDFRRALAEAVRGVDEQGEVPPGAARQLRRTLPASRRAALNAAPHEWLGPFSELPPSARREILAFIAARDRWNVRGHELGWLHHATLRVLWRIRGLLEDRESAVGRSLGPLADVLAYGTRKGPAQLIARIHHELLRLNARVKRSPRLSVLLPSLGVDSVDLATCYARDIPQAETYRAYWHDEKRRNTVGAVIGIDLLPTDEGCWYVESNLDLAQRPERSELYERDPFVEALLAFAERRGYRRLVVLDNNSSGVDPKMAPQYEAGARERGLELTLVDRVNVPGSPYLRSYGIPELSGEGTLVARLKSYPTCIDGLFKFKRSSHQALSRYRQEAGDSDLLLPESSAEPVFGAIEPDEPFPNVVFKLPELDAARGVFFLKAESAEHARALADEALRKAAPDGLQARVQRSMSREKGLYQAYVRSRLLPQRRLYIIRAHVLVTPVGVEFLSAHRVVSGRSVPEELPLGFVRDPTPYLVNFSAGSWYETVPDDEEPAVIRAARAVGCGLAWAVDYGFVTRPEGVN